MKTIQRAVAAFGTFLMLTAGAAEAIIITVIEDNDNTFFDYSNDANEVDFDIDWFNIKPVSLGVELESGDTGGDLYFSGFHNNFTGIGWTDFHVTLINGPVWSQINDISPTPSTTTGGQGAADISLFFNTPIPENATLTLGNPNTSGDAADWRIARGNLVPGSAFQIELYPTIAPVPVPATLALLGIGLAGLGFTRMNKRA